MFKATLSLMAEKRPCCPPKPLSNLLTLVTERLRACYVPGKSLTKFCERNSRPYMKNEDQNHLYRDCIFSDFKLLWTLLSCLLYTATHHFISSLVYINFTSARPGLCEGLKNSARWDLLVDIIICCCGRWCCCCCCGCCCCCCCGCCCCCCCSFRPLVRAHFFTRTPQWKSGVYVHFVHCAQVFVHVEAGVVLVLTSDCFGTYFTHAQT